MQTLEVPRGAPTRARAPRPASLSVAPAHGRPRARSPAARNARGPAGTARARARSWGADGCGPAASRSAHGPLRHDRGQHCLGASGGSGPIWGGAHQRPRLLSWRPCSASHGTDDEDAGARKSPKSCLPHVPKSHPRRPGELLSCPTTPEKTPGSVDMLLQEPRLCLNSANSDESDLLPGACLGKSSRIGCQRRPAANTWPTWANIPRISATC